MIFLYQLDSSEAYFSSRFPVATLAALEHRISLDDGNVALSDFARELGQATGISITVSPDIADRKVSAFCSARPASDVMRAVERCLWLRWEPSSGGLRLSRPDDLRLQESQAAAAERAYLAEALARKVALWKSYADTPRGEIEQQIRELDARIRSARSKGSDGGQTLGDLIAKRRKLDDRAFFPLGGCLSGSALTVLLRGQPLVASTLEGAEYRIPTGNLPLRDITVRIGNSELVKTPKGAVAILRVDRSQRRLIGRLYLSGLGEMAVLAGELFAPVGDGTEAASPLTERLAKWSSGPAEPVLNAPVQQAEGELKGPYSVDGLSAAEELRDLAERSGIPIVADAFRVKLWTGRVEGRTVAEWVAKAKAAQSGAGNGVPTASFRAEGGWLMMRHGEFWRLETGEIPERLLRSAEARTPPGEAPELDVAATLASSLSPEQAENLLDSPLLLTRFARSTMGQCLQQLRLWGTLGTGERESARSASGLSAASLSPKEGQAFLDAVFGFALTRPLPDRFLLPLISGQPLPSDLRLYVRDRVAEPGTYVWGDRPPSPEMESSKLTVTHTTDFGFGTSPSDLLRATYSTTGGRDAP